jgi:hypothetical protein
MRVLALLVVLLAGCATQSFVAGWQGPDVHLVDGRWIGTEAPCAQGQGGLECRTVVDRALALVTASVRVNVTRATRAAVLGSFVTPTGETRIAQFGGLDRADVVVLDMADGSRRLVGLVCYLPYEGNGGGLALEMVTCEANPLDNWRNADGPPAHSPEYR